MCKRCLPTFDKATYLNDNTMPKNDFLNNTFTETEIFHIL